MDKPAKFANGDKFERAFSVVYGKRAFGDGAVENTALAKVLANGVKPKSDEAVEAVYRILGGLVFGDAKVEKVKAVRVEDDGSEVISERTEGLEIEDLGKKKRGKR